MAVGDVVGTGPEAAATTAMVRYSLRALTVRSIEPLNAVALLNETMVAASVERGNDETFCTAIVGSLQSTGDRLEVVLVSGGHPFPYIRRRNGTLEEVTLGGLLLGVLPDARFAATNLTLTDGDQLVLFTDGILEARSGTGEMFGVEGVRRVLADCTGSARETADTLEAAVVTHVAGELVDDLAVLVIMCCPEDAGRSAANSG